MRGYTCSSALSAIREILYHPVKYDVELVSEIKGVLREIADAAEPSGRASAQGELAATVPPVGAANTGSLAIAKLLQWADVALKGTLAYDSLSLFIHEQRQASA